MATQDDYIRTALRVPPDLHARIHEAAKANTRTFNAEIVARLESTFASANRTGLPTEVIQELERLFDERLGQKAYIDTSDGAGMTTLAPALKKVNT